MLNLGFQEEMEQIFALLPKKRQSLLFSATMDENIESLIFKLLKNPVKIAIETESITPDLIAQSAYLIGKTYHALGLLGNLDEKLTHCQQTNTWPKGSGSTAWLAKGPQQSQKG
jgi:superfamily II DNA/RNA helicase